MSSARINVLEKELHRVSVTKDYVKSRSLLSSIDGTSRGSSSSSTNTNVKKTINRRYDVSPMTSLHHMPPLLPQRLPLQDTATLLLLPFFGHAKPSNIDCTTSIYGLESRFFPLAGGRSLSQPPMQSTPSAAAVYSTPLSSVQHNHRLLTSEAVDTKIILTQRKREQIPAAKSPINSSR